MIVKLFCMFIGFIIGLIVSMVCWVLYNDN